MKEQLILYGTMPERALSRLAVAGIPLFDVKKKQKNQILLRIREKDVEKAFAIYPNLCYNDKSESVYFLARANATDARTRELRRRRWVGILLGACLFPIILGGLSPFVYRVEIVGTEIYRREVLQTLADFGIREFCPYQTSFEDLITAKLLALDGVEYCSVKKQGGSLRVELRMNVFSSSREESGGLIAPRGGRIVGIVVLKGTPEKSVGMEVTEGESLVGGYLSAENGERVPSATVAKAKLYCEESFFAPTLEEAEQTAILYAETLGGELAQLTETPEEEGVRVTVGFFLTVKKNM